MPDAATVPTAPSRKSGLRPEILTTHRILPSCDERAPHLGYTGDANERTTSGARTKRRLPVAVTVSREVLVLERMRNCA